MATSKHSRELARQLFKLSFADGQLSAERVQGVLGYVEKTQPAQSLAVLQLYLRLVSREVARGEAVVEHAGTVSDTTLQGIATNLSRKYGRPVTAIAKRNDALLAGLRVRIGDDLYETSVSGQLATLSAST